MSYTNNTAAGNGADKNYAAGLFIREKTFANGNSILNVSISRDKFIEWLMGIPCDEKGYCKIGISKRLQANDKGLTHTAWEDKWKPTPKQPDAQPASKPSDVPSAVEDQYGTLPF